MKSPKLNEVYKNNPQVEIYHIEQFNEPSHLCDTCKLFKIMPDAEQPQKFDNWGVCMYEEWKGDTVSRFDGCRHWMKGSN